MMTLKRKSNDLGTGVILTQIRTRTFNRSTYSQSKIALRGIYGLDRSFKRLTFYDGACIIPATSTERN